jgi:hypothetical protein
VQGLSNVPQRSVGQCGLRENMIGVVEAELVESGVPDGLAVEDNGVDVLLQLPDVLRLIDLLHAPAKPASQLVARPKISELAKGHGRRRRVRESGGGHCTGRGRFFGSCEKAINELDDGWEHIVVDLTILPARSDGKLSLAGDPHALGDVHNNLAPQLRLRFGGTRCEANVNPLPNRECKEPDASRLVEGSGRPSRHDYLPFVARPSFRRR